MAGPIHQGRTGSPTRRSPTRRTQQDDEQDSRKNLLLHKSLTPGLLIAASLTSPEELIDKNLLELNEDSRVSLQLSDIKLLYKAKCEDQNLQVLPKREDRFLELIHKSCSGLLFSLKEHGLGKESGEAIYQVLSNNQSYSILELCGNRLRDDGTKALSQLLEVNDSLVRLDLRSNDIGGKGGDALFKSLRHNCTLTSLDLSGLSGINRNHIGIKGAVSLCSMLQVNRVLSQINLGSNGMGADGIKLLCNGLKNNHVLTELDISSNNMGIQGCEYIANCLRFCSLKRLIMERNMVCDRGLTVLSNMLKQHHNNTLRHLNISENKITHLGVRDMCSMLKLDNMLHTIKLDGNEVGDKGVEELSAMLEVNKSVVNLTLSKNEIQDLGCSYIGKCMRINRTLRKLNLSSNYIEDPGIIYIANALKENKCLSWLDVGHNRIGDEGGVVLAKSLLSNQCLQWLSIKENDMRVAGEHIADAMRKNNTLMFLDFTYNNFSYKSYSFISDALKRNIRRYEGGAKDRLKKQITDLQKNEQILSKVNLLTRKEIELRESADDKYVQEQENIAALNDKYSQEIAEAKSLLQNKHQERRDAEARFQQKMDQFAVEIHTANQEQRKLEQRIDSERERVVRLKKEVLMVSEAIELSKKRADLEKKPYLMELENEERRLMVAKEKNKTEESEYDILKKKLKALEKLATSESGGGMSLLTGSVSANARASATPTKSNLRGVGTPVDRSSASSTPTKGKKNK
ncbi:hypothetical protein AKO1_009979 [Acrasis kona]|uniref:Uncharacterized protein n=1 Tax=Acrasis kona TaxID=1008807 RepID=A0AAW2ZN39_9EUKA